MNQINSIDGNVWQPILFKNITEAIHERPAHNLQNRCGIFDKSDISEWPAF